MKSLSIPVIISSIFILCACSDNLYIPNHQAVKLFEKKNELVLSSSRSFGNGIGAELGYSLTNNIGVNTAFNRFDISYDDENNSKFFGDYNWQNELVLFNKFNNKFYLGLNIGYGIGKYSTNNPYFNIDMQQKYLLPSVGYCFTPKFSIFLSTRRSLVNYQLHPLVALNSDYDKEMFDKYFQINGIHNRHNYLSEPALTINYSLQDIRLQAQMICLSDAPEKMIPINFVVSASVDLCKLFRNWKK